MRARTWIGDASAAVLLLEVVGGASAHSLDGVSFYELTATVAILEADGKVGDDAHVPLIELKESVLGTAARSIGW